eukprot:709047-Hanusia_phi.AAC.1
MLGMHRLSTPERLLRFQKVKHLLRYRTTLLSNPKEMSRTELGMKAMTSSVQESIAKASAGLLEREENLMISEEDEEKQEQKNCALTCYLKLKGRYPGGIMDKKLRLIVTGIQHSMTSSVIFSSNPITNALYKTTFQVTLTLTGILLSYMYGSTHNLQLVITNNSSLVHAARLEVLQHRDQVPRGFLPAASVSNWTLLFDGCSELRPSNFTALNNSLYFSFSPPARANGWRFSLGRPEQLRGFDPVAFSLYVLDQPFSEDAPAVPAERWRKWTEFSCQATPSVSICREDNNEGAVLSFNVELHVDVYLHHFFAFFQPFACFASVLASRLRHPKVSKFFLASLFHVVGVWEFSVLATQELTRSRQIYQLIWATSDFSFGLVIQFAEQYMMTVVPLYSLVTSVGGSAASSDFFQKPIGVDNMGYSNFVLMTAWLYFVVGRRVHLLKASRNMKAELVKYHELWTSLSSSDDGVRSLHRIMELASQVEEPGRVFQGRMQEIHGLHTETSGLLEWVITGGQQRASVSSIPSKCTWLLSKQPLVTSLDQLYAQAVFLHPIFLKKVQGLAAACRGMFHISLQDQEHPVEYILWEDAMEKKELVHKVRWASIKKLDRAVEKLVRSYNSDVSRLLDLVRQCIVFERLEDLCQ